MATIVMAAATVAAAVVAVAAWRTATSARNAARDSAAAAERSAASAERIAAIDHERRLEELAPKFDLRYLGSLDDPRQHLVEVENAGIQHERIHVGVVGWGNGILEALTIEERVAEPHEAQGRVNTPGDTPCNVITLGRVETGERCVLRVFEADEHGGGELRLRITTIRSDLDHEASVNIGCGQHLPPAHPRRR